MINFLISHNNTNSQSTEQQCNEKKENSQTRGYHLIEQHNYFQRYFNNTCVTDSEEN